MIDILRQRLPIRLRLTLWYLLLMGVTFTAFSIHLTLRLKNNMQNSIDSSLQITVAKTIAGLDAEDYVETGRMTFDHIGSQGEPSDFAMRLVSDQGETWDTYGSPQPAPEWNAPTPAFFTLTGSGESPDWRLYSQPILDSTGQVIGWLQAARSLESVDRTLESLTNQLLFGIPLVLLLAGVGGVFLAGRALNPIDLITKTARSIDAEDLSRRLEYRGADDELGRFAQTFDQMLTRLQTAFERERRFIADAAHELRTPLTVLKGQIEVTLSRARSSVEHEAKLRELAAQVDRLIRLSNALLFLSRAGQQPVSSGPVNVSDILETVIEQMQPLTDVKPLHVRTSIPPGLTVPGDSDALTRLFLNLLENAWKYTPAEGMITISAMGDAGGMRVLIHNSGAGIPPEHLPHLFEPFYRAEGDRSRATGGSGLGLAIAREIARQQRGLVMVESEAGEGVTVTVHLPY